jgi:xanthine dehydrogenase accessory factor
MKDVLDMLRGWDAAKLASTEAILVGTQHSSPRSPGARLVVNEKGEMAGGVSMGCVESDLREHLLGLLRGEGAPRMVHYGQSFGAALEVGLTCGGEIDVWIRRRMPGSPVDEAVARMSPDARAILLTRLEGASDQRLLDGEALACGSAAYDGLRELWRRGGTARMEIDGAAHFAELLAPDPSLLVVGASPIASALCELASRTGFRVWIVDPRRDFARPSLFPSAAGVVHRWPEEGLAAAGLDAHSYVAVLAHDAKLDVPALAAALRAGARYVGLLGSRRTQADRREALRAAGFAEAQVAAIHGPIGLKAIGALEPAEIAVSILAELIRERRGGKPSAA